MPILVTVRQATPPPRPPAIRQGVRCCQSTCPLIMCPSYFRAFVLLLWLGVDAHAASFECDKAKSKLDRMICADAVLSRLDDVLEVEYTGSLVHAADRMQARDAHRAWRVVRNQCHDAACLRKVYVERILALACTINQGAPASARLCFDLRLQTAEMRLRLLEQPHPWYPKPATANGPAATDTRASEDAAWRQHRDAACARESDEQGGTDAWKMAWASACALEATEQRLQLRERERKPAAAHPG